jgi:pilus assembly protein Flp/PilA
VPASKRANAGLNKVVRCRLASGRVQTILASHPFSALNQEFTMTKLIKKFWNDEDGATMVEYGLMVALIAVVLIATIILVQQGLQTVFTEVATQLNTAANPS